MNSCIWADKDILNQLNEDFVNIACPFSVIHHSFNMNDLSFVAHISLIMEFVLSKSALRVTFPLEKHQKDLGYWVEVPWYETSSCLNGSRMRSGMYYIYLLFFYS